MRPILKNPVWVTVQPIARASLHVDAAAEEPYSGIARGSDVRILMQLDELAEDTRTPQRRGARVEASHLATWRSADADARSWSPADGDRIVLMESRRPPAWSRTVNWYLSGPRDLAVGRGGRPMLSQGALSDRPANRQQTEGR